MPDHGLTEYQLALLRTIRQVAAQGELSVLRATWQGRPACYLISCRAVEAGHEVRPLAVLPTDLAEMQQMDLEIRRFLTAALQSN